MPSIRTNVRSGAAVARAQDMLLVARLGERMAAIGTDGAKVSRAAMLGSTAVNDIMTGKNKNPSVPVIKAIAQALGCSVAYLVGETDNPKLDADQKRVLPIPVIGVAEAGAFRQMGQALKSEELPTVDAPDSRRYPGARRFALEVRGDSMNAVPEGPITEGMYVLCVDVAEAHLSVESGKIYAIRRTVDHGQTFETTIKRAMVFRDRVELLPESTNPIHEKIIVPKDFEAEPAHGVIAIGLIYGTVNTFEK